jgi:putative colanic acid biosynthesis UDP-glucose lipid carrier transferase
MNSTTQGVLHTISRQLLTWTNVNTQEIIREKRGYFLYKRLIDTCISLVVIMVLLSWLVPLIALAIKLDSRGPVFFVQRRVGRFGRTFRCLKFRTMKMNIEADFKQAQENDNRITRVGKYLRLSNLDEFPQFINVLLGQMSIVGPRPHMHKDCWEFTKVVKDYKYRNLVKPGITGMAQVRGFRGPTDTDSSIVMRYNWDIFYVKNASSTLDRKVILITANQTFFQIAKIVLGEKRLMAIKQRREYYRIRRVAA